jgi:hypothetical protein
MNVTGSTEDEIVTQMPKEITLGDKKYKLKPLTLRKAMEWRAQYGPELSRIMASYGAKADSTEEFMAAFINSAELMANAVFAYMPELPKEKILDTCTEQEMFGAFAAVMGVAFGPFLGEVAFMKMFKKELDRVTSPASEPSSSLQ